MPLADILEKFRDAMSMFWSSLAETEKKVVLFYGCYLVASIVLYLQGRSRERLKRELLEELRGGR